MNSQLPTLNRQGRSLIDNAMSGLGFARHPMVSRAGNRFTLVDGAGNARPLALMDQVGRIYMDVVIFDASPHPNRMFFKDTYEPDSNQPPDCFSDNGKGPSTQSRNPQALTCAVCPNAVWGSKVTPQGKEVPACQVGKKLAVLVLGDESGLAYEFRVPPGSFSGQPQQDPSEGGWTWYLKSLKGYGKELFDVVTRITFVPNTMGLLVFKPVAIVEGNAELVNRINDAWTRDTGADLIGKSDKAIDPEMVGQRPQGQMPPPPAAQQGQQAGAQAWPQGGQQFGNAASQLGQQAASSLTGGVPNVGGPAHSSGEPAKRTRRTKAQIEADNAAKGHDQFLAGIQAHQVPSGLQQAPAQGAPVAPQDDIPPFLRRQTATAPAVTTVAANQDGLGGFGLQQPAAPSPDLQARLAQAFSLPTGGKQ